MKMFLFTIVATAAINASASYVTVQVCDGGESGTVCHNVTYKVRPASPAQQVKETCTAGESGFEVPCNQNAHVPKWLAKLNQALLDAGFTAPVENPYVNGGGQ